MPAGFVHEPVAGDPGWWTWNPADRTRFNESLGPIAIRYAERGSATALVRMRPEVRHSNLQDVLHGGVTLAFLDVALFAACRALGIPIGRGAVTVDVSCQFVDAGRIGADLIAEVELMKETGRLIFLRGRMHQSGHGAEHLIAAFSGLLRKGRPEAR